MGKFQLLFSRRQERELEKEWPESKRTIASGAKWQKGDLHTKEIHNVEFVIECKATQNASFSITKKIWDLVKSQAESKSWIARPILAIRFYGPTIEEESWGERENTPETLKVLQDLIIIDKDDFLELFYDYLRLKGIEDVGY